MALKNARMSQQKRDFFLLFTLISFTFLGILYLSLRFGAKSMTHQELMQVLLHQSSHQRQVAVLWDMRLPRIFAAILVGAALAISGALMQALTRNPIADPGLLGINSGAGLALVIAYAFFHHLHYSVIILVCLLGSILASLIIFSLSYRVEKGYQQLRLILAGAMVSTLLSALGRAITNYFHLANAIIGWQAGGLVGTNWQMLAYIAPIILISLMTVQVLAYQLSVLSLSQMQSKALGQSTTKLTIIFLGLVLLLASASVAIAGNIAFVGLIIPHLIKNYLPQNYQLSLPLIAFAGATFLLAVDLICRTMNPPFETPLTAIISFLGFPAFLWLVRKGGKA
ncbi:FecCD family ABC transporter permease [Streptococcus pseudoporcinus]|uniref:Ferrichrome ABC transporter permease n=1 Tax=Streptococcus pseudoporcinus TaxID=361101 RepID=A0A4U9XYD4_9STRE|nr:iron ABC transporter permease [Streptococcus pseudoporcinus]VTS18784.1 ferrichrome ABC transporter permease [Streptococcus pseudoporcinus]VUC68713.1 ferrichrome ABC transporter permease [Streptococcus pseudoporcinus]VUC99406.1 ferrichrome ABC transporter permease [Streptococcus pseudoporcinus]VUC99798.1 ferrichrome ABC transporter permease [Streptococcus pseudoporcinus]